ncbi:MAG: GHKL domain-containing protein [Oscillospiraceae bacterium]|nr:GHKL domain-containing protein [Oscillospiraceae bacterium]
MRDRTQAYIPVILALVLGIVCAFCLMVYASPMEDVSLDLSLVSQEDAVVLAPENFDNKGWTVYTQEGETVTELTPDGLGGYTGLELGQTFYYSRVMSEELDSPTLQLGAVEYTFSVWLDDVLIYTDCPDLDNRIGYLRLPMNGWCRETPITISLPADYQGKTLTIAQSFPEWTETSFVKAWPTSVRLYCGYAYESGLISETFQTAVVAAAMCLIVLLLLVSFVRSRDWSVLCLALVAFCVMAGRIVATSFFPRYFGSTANDPTGMIPLLSALGLLVFLTLRGGKHRKLLWGAVGLYGLSVIGYGVFITALHTIPADHFAATLCVEYLPWWLAFAGITAILVLGAVYWRKENWFYRVFTPMALACIVISWLSVILPEKGIVWQQVLISLGSGQIQYVYYRTIPAVTVAALMTAIAEFVRTELNRRAERQLMKQSRELALESYEHLRRQHEEVMMLRHDMLRHFRTLHDMGGDEKRTEYLAKLIGQNQMIRPIVESGNEMLDIILNGRLGAAVDAGIRVDIPHITAPSALPLSDPDLCALVMNIVDNAITAASETDEPYLMLKIHEKEGYLAIVCENSFDPKETEAKQETVPKHGWGLKIIRNIVEKYRGAIIAENNGNCFSVKIVIPLA